MHRHGGCLGCAVAIVGHYIGLAAFHVTFHALAQLLDYIGGHLAAVDYGCVAARALVNICYSLLHAGTPSTAVSCSLAACRGVAACIAVARSHLTIVTLLQLYLLGNVLCLGRGGGRILH